MNGRHLSESDLIRVILVDFEPYMSALDAQGLKCSWKSRGLKRGSLVTQIDTYWKIHQNRRFTSDLICIRSINVAKTDISCQREILNVVIQLIFFF